jgi:hypothetical protein
MQPQVITRVRAAVAELGAAGAPPVTIVDLCR